MTRDRATTLRIACTLGCVLAPACMLEQRYDPARATVALHADDAPAFSDQQDTVFRAEQEFPLHLTKPSAADLRARATPSPPYPREPWVALSDLELQLDYALESGSDEPVVVDLTLDGSNEFHAYAPTFEDLHQWSRRIALPARGRSTGSIDELELDEVAIDLATVVNGAPNSNLVVDPRSQSGRDPRVAAFVPARVPGLTAVRVGIETTRAVALTLTLSIRVQDHGGRAARRGEASWTLPTPTPFVPVVPEGAR